MGHRRRAGLDLEMSVRDLWHRWLALRRRLDRLALPLGLSGLVGVTLYNWRQWQQDKKLLAQVKEPPPLPPLEAWPDLPLVSVLVAAWNEADFIERHVESFLELRYPNKELVLCAGGEDDTLALARQHEGPQVKVLAQRPGEGKQRALVRSLPRAQGTIIYLTDADCLLDDDAFERTVLPIVTDGGGAVTGTSRPLSELLEAPFIRHQWAPQRYLERLPAESESRGLLGRNCALERSLLVRAWATDRPVPTGTDYFLALRLRQAGYVIKVAPDSSIETHYPETVAAYIRQRSRWLRNLLLLGYRFGDAYHVRHALLTALTGSAFLFLPFLPLLLGLSGVSVWAAVWLAAGLKRHRYINHLDARSNRSPTLLLSFSLWQLLVADFISWARLLVDVWRRQWREQW